MFVVLRPGCKPEDRNRLIAAIERVGLCVEVSEGHHRIVIGVVGNEDKLREVPLATHPGVEKVLALKAPYRLAARGDGVMIEMHPTPREALSDARLALVPELRAMPQVLRAPSLVR